jgi:hypothetical protein
MKKETLRTAGGRPIGTVTTLDNGREEITDAGGRPRGSFDPRSNQTKDRTGRVKGPGNQLSSLLTSC